MTEVVDNHQAPDLSVPRVRGLVIDFYKRHQPVALEEGLDVSGLVQWIVDNGLERFNEVLKSNFNGRYIDPDTDLGSNQRQFQRTSMAITPNLFQKVQDDRLRIKRKLTKFYKKYDESRLLPEHEFQFQRVINFGVKHGIRNLNKLLVRKYAEGIKEEDTESELAEEQEEEADAEENNGHAVNVVDIDEPRLRVDLTIYFQKVDAEDQTELLDNHVDWVCRMGFKVWNEKSKQLYGTSFDDVLMGMGRDPWEEGFGGNSKDIVIDATDFDEEGRPISTREWRPGMPFEKLTDDEIGNELSAFYEYFDPDNLENMEKLIDFARDLGRTKLNLHLQEIYRCGLRDDMTYAGLLVRPSASMATVGSIQLEEILREENKAQDKEVDILDSVEAIAEDESQNGDDREPKLSVLQEIPEDNKEEELPQQELPKEEELPQQELPKEEEPEKEVPEEKSESVDEGEDDFELDPEAARNFMQQQKAQAETKKPAGGLLGLSKKLLKNKSVKSVFSSFGSARKQVVVKRKTIDDAQEAAKIMGERNRKGGSLVTKLDGHTSERDLFAQRSLQKTQVHKSVRHRGRGSVARLVQRTEKRMKRKPTKLIMKRITAAEKQQDDHNPFLMLSSTRIRKRWHDEDDADKKE